MSQLPFLTAFLEKKNAFQFFSCKTSEYRASQPTELWIDVLQSHLPAQQNVTFHEVNGRALLTTSTLATPISPGCSRLSSRRSPSGHGKVQGTEA